MFDALVKFAQAKEKVRFSTIFECLQRPMSETWDEEDQVLSIPLQISALDLINQIIHSIGDLVERFLVRQEFINLGLLVPTSTKIVN